MKTFVQSSINRIQNIIKSSIVYSVLFLIVAIIFVVGWFSFRPTTAAAGIGFDNPVDPLPADNLLSFDCAWFRDSENTDPRTMPSGWCDWQNHDDNGSLSRGANKNPSPDNDLGTAAQWDEITGCQQSEECAASIIVDAPAEHDELKFSTWHVSRHLIEMTVTVYGCDDAVGFDCDFVWQPFVNFETTQFWEQSDVVSMPVDVPYPFYEIVIKSIYSGGTAGTKVTGVYFAANSTVVDPTSTPSPIPTSTPTPMPTATPTIEPTATPCDASH